MRRASKRRGGRGFFWCSPWNLNAMPPPPLRRWAPVCCRRCRSTPRKATAPDCRRGRTPSSQRGQWRYPVNRTVKERRWLRRGRWRRGKPPRAGSSPWNASLPNQMRGRKDINAGRWFDWAYIERERSRIRWRINNNNYYYYLKKIQAKRRPKFWPKVINCLIYWFFQKIKVIELYIYLNCSLLKYIMTSLVSSYGYFDILTYDLN